MPFISCMSRLPTCTRAKPCRHPRPYQTTRIQRFSRRNPVLFARVSNPGYVWAAVDLLQVSAVAAAPSSSVRRVEKIFAAGSIMSATLSDGSTFAISRLLGAHVRKGDELFIGEGAPVDSPPAEALLHRPSLKHADILQAKVGY